MKIALPLFFVASLASASSFSFQGNFAEDDQLQLFSFQVDTVSTVTTRTWSYAGGANAAGQSVTRGGFDPILSIFGSDGHLIGYDDDGSSLVAADAVTGQHYDSFLQESLAPGAYILALTQYYGFPAGSTLSAGFRGAGLGNFTANYGCSAHQFCDVTGDSRSGAWAVELLNVSQANAVPEPGTQLLLGVALFSIGALRRASRSCREKLNNQ